MHDPNILAFSIEWPFKGKNGLRRTLIDIWHVDPEMDGTDDSCGWFGRARHTDPEKRIKIQKEFLFNLQHNYWFTADGIRQFSVSAIMLEMYRAAVWIHFDHHRGKFNSFLRKHLHHILSMAENPTDCIGDRITGKYGYRICQETVIELADTVYADIFRLARPWYKHPRWHLHHWKVRFHWPKFRRRSVHTACITGQEAVKP